MRILEIGKNDGVHCNSEYLGSHMPVPEASRVTLGESSSVAQFPHSINRNLIRGKKLFLLV